MSVKKSRKATKLIILRGPSGAGKTTIAKRLHSESNRHVVLIEQDYYRTQMMKMHQAMSEEGKVMWNEMFASDITIALNHGYDVIVEGIFKPTRYMELFEKIWADHPTENYMFYFDISFDETARRHLSRKKSEEFSVDEMHEWYNAAQRSDLEWEVIIPEESSQDETVANIKAVTGI